MLRPFWLAAALLLPLTACDSLASGDQAAFEDQAYLTVPGSVDVWRVGPAFDARVSILQPPTPNPASSNDEVVMQLDVTVAAPGGFALYRLYPEDGRLALVQSLSGVSSPWFYTFTFLGRDVDPLAQAGTYRLLVLDGTERVVAYGDFRLRS